MLKIKKINLDLLPHLVPCGGVFIPQVVAAYTNLLMLIIVSNLKGGLWQKQEISTIFMAAQHCLVGGIFGPNFWMYLVHIGKIIVGSLGDEQVESEAVIPNTRKHETNRNIA